MTRDDARCPRPAGFYLRIAMSAMLLGFAGCRAPGPTGSDCRPTVFIIPGTAGYFPRLGEFKNRLLDRGICPAVSHPSACTKLAEQIIDGWNEGRLTGPVVIAGYSSGADQALRLAWQLGQQDVTVDKLVLLEPTLARSVPCNVRSCFNIYKGQPWGYELPWLRGYAVSAESPETDLFNYNLRDDDGRFRGENHFTLSANRDVQELMVDEIVAGMIGEMTTAPPVSGGLVPRLSFSDHE